eukprot:328168-Pyramimonas_sp.AAC.1
MSRRLAWREAACSAANEKHEPLAGKAAVGKGGRTPDLFSTFSYFMFLPTSDRWASPPAHPDIVPGELKRCCE